MRLESINRDQISYFSSFYPLPEKKLGDERYVSVIFQGQSGPHL